MILLVKNIDELEADCVVVDQLDFHEVAEFLSTEFVNADVDEIQHCGCSAFGLIIIVLFDEYGSNHGSSFTEVL